MKRIPLLILITAVSGAVSISSLAVADAVARPNADTSTREIAWDGSESLVLGVPAELRFVQTPGPGKVAVTGPRRSLENFTVSGGYLSDNRLRTGERLTIVVHAPKITRFSAKGGDKIVIENFDQEALRIETTGRADVMASGRAGTLQLNLQGSGWADLSQLATKGAEVFVSGSRHAVIAPQAWARISGNGGVVLLTQPADLKLALGESGRVIHAAPRS